MNPNFEQELEDAMDENNDKKAPVFTAIPGTNLTGNKTGATMAPERLVELGQQKYDEARKLVNELETEFQLKRTEILERLRIDTDEMTVAAKRKLSNLQAEYDRRKEPAERMMALVARLSDGRGNDW